MRVEPIAASGENVKPAIQTKIPATAETDSLVTPTETQAGETAKDPTPELASEMQRNLSILHQVDLQFSLHEASGRMMVMVKDETSGKIIREIPPKEMLDLAAKMDEMVGLLFDAVS